MSEQTTTAPPADRLTHAVHGLVEDGTLTPQQAAQVVARLRPLVPRQATPAKAKGPLVEFAGYLGGALFLGGISLVVVPTWDGLPYPARLGLAAAVTVILVAAAVLIGQPCSTLRNRPPRRPGSPRHSARWPRVPRRPPRPCWRPMTWSS